MFVTKDRLSAEFERGRSLAQIARELGVHPSTVGYWAAKHGLEPPHARKYARRGAPQQRQLERLAAEGATLKEIAAALDRSTATVRHWLKAGGSRASTEGEPDYLPTRRGTLRSPARVTA